MRRLGMLVNGFEHAPAGGAPVGVAREAVHVPDGFDGFGAGKGGEVSKGMEEGRRETTYRRMYSFALMRVMPRGRRSSSIRVLTYSSWLRGTGGE
jgi:hypothetical protein